MVALLGAVNRGSLDSCGLEPGLARAVPQPPCDRPLSFSLALAVAIIVSDHGSMLEELALIERVQRQHLRLLVTSAPVAAARAPSVGSASKEPVGERLARLPAARLLA